MSGIFRPQFIKVTIHNGRCYTLIQLALRFARCLLGIPQHAQHAFHFIFDLLARRIQFFLFFFRQRFKFFRRERLVVASRGNGNTTGGIDHRDIYRHSFFGKRRKHHVPI